jgi:phage protein D
MSYTTLLDDLQSRFNEASIILAINIEETLLSQIHKTGVNDTKKGPILEVDLKKRQYDQSTYTRLDE